MQGISVTVKRPTVTGTDRLGAPVHGKPTEEVVAGVLVAPGASSDMEAGRPEGVTIAYTLHFPKSYRASLRGCTIVLPEPWDNDGIGYRVVGDPQPYMDANTPGPWNRPVEVSAAYG